MNFSLKLKPHFYFLFIALFLTSCAEQEKDNDIDELITEVKNNFAHFKRLAFFFLNYDN